MLVVVVDLFCMWIVDKTQRDSQVRENVCEVASRQIVSRVQIMASGRVFEAGRT